MHRLDFDTNGLILIAKNQKTYDFFSLMQAEGCFIKKYQALCSKNSECIQGFPPFSTERSIPGIIESYFRSFGPGRKEVRPVLHIENKYRAFAADRGETYKTEVCSAMESRRIINNIVNTFHLFDIKIKRGFRHQIRCHLAWMGYPIINDTLYNQDYKKEKNKPLDNSFMALCSYSLVFPVFDTGIEEFTINCDNNLCTLPFAFFEDSR
jgi:23S rRNA pseudouridine1911/1915/1917 synthase